MTPEETAVLERFRAVCLALPEVEDIVRDAYRKVAPKTLAARLA